MGQRTKAVLNRTASLRRGVILLAAQGIFPLAAQAQSTAAGVLPTNPRVAAGLASIATAGTRMDVTQTTQKAVINWDTFNIGKSAQVNFNQPNSSAVVLNRVTTGTASMIDGKLTANGQVFLINPAGVYFGNGSSVSVGGLVASTMGITDKDFLDGNYRFTRDGTTGAIVNQGRLEAAEGGYIALLAPEVINEGVIFARRGTVGVGAGEAAVLDFEGDRLLNLRVDPATIRTLIESKQVIEAEGGLVILSSQAMEAVTAGIINLSGFVKASTIEINSGKGDTVLASATLDASNLSQGGVGGTVKALGNRVGLFGNTHIDVSGESGGGTVLIGGNWQGKGPEQNASVSYVGKDVSINADAIAQGNGGKVVTWADGTTRFHGSISAGGGANGGDGGSIETSGKQALDVAGAKVSALAPHGKNGIWLLDPTAITVAAIGANATTAQVDQFADADQGGPGNSTIDPATLVAANATVSLQASNTITFTDAVNLTFAGAGLFARAGGNIVVNANITTNNGAVFLRANDPGGSAAGTGSVFGNGNISTGTGNFTVETTNSTGGINLSGTITSAGTVSFRVFDASAVAPIVVNNASNDFSGATVQLNASSLPGPVTLRANSAIQFGDQGVRATNLDVQAGGAITQTALSAFQVSGTSTFNAGANAITIANASNDFIGAVSLSNTGANAVQITDANALTLGTLSVAAGNLTAISTGALNLGTGTVGGNLTAISNGGTITETGALAIAGASTFSAGNGAITLTDAGNDFGGTVTLFNSGANDIAIRDVNALDLGRVEAGGNFAASAGTTLSLASGATLSANGAGDAITLAGTKFINNAGTNAAPSSLTFAQIGALTLIEVSAFTSKQLQALTIPQISGLTAAQIPVIRPSDISSLTAAQIAALTAIQVSSLTTAQLGAFTLTQVAALTPLQVAALSGAQLAALGTAPVAPSPVMSSPSGRWLVWSSDPAQDTRAGLTYDFKQYNASYGVSTVQGSGDGFLYTLAPTVTAGLAATTSKTYDASTSASLAAGNFTQSGAIDGDSVALNTPFSGNFADKNVGSGKTVTAAGISIAGATNGAATVYGYQMASGSASGAIGDITPASLAVNANSASKIYGQTVSFNGTEFTASGLLGGETIGAVTLTSNGAAATAGVTGSPYSIVPSAATGGSFSAGNYAITYNNGTLTISAAPLGLHLDSLSKQKNAQDPPFTVTITTGALLNGDMLTGSAQRDSGEATGSYAIRPGNLSGGPNYTVTFVNGKLTIADEPSLLCRENCITVKPPCVGESCDPKPAQYAAAVGLLRVDSQAADLPECKDEEQAEQGDCIARRKSRSLARSTDIANKHAILIGVNDYKSKGVPPLETPVGDIEAIGGLLQTRFGYQPHFLKNPTKRDLAAFFNKAIEWVGPNDSLMIYYAGHGFLMEDEGMGYWLPADAEGDSPRNWLSNADVSRYLSALAAKQIALISDSCFSGSLTQKLQVASIGAADRGRILSRRSVVIMTSGDVEPVSDEGLDGHSIFAWSMLKRLDEIGGMTPTTVVFPKIKEDVTNAFPQTPQLGAALKADHEQGTDYLLEPVGSRAN